MNAGSVVTILPFYNRRRAIVPTLDSVAAQTVPTERLILVDDGSTDGGAEVVRAWIRSSAQHLDCRLVEQANCGVAAARNRGLELAGDSDFVAFLDSDDVWPPDFLERTRGLLAAEPAAVAATCDRRIVFYDGRSSETRSSAGLTANPVRWMLEYGADICSATLFRLDAVRNRGGFNPALRTGEDSELFLPLSLDGPWLYAPGEGVTVGRGLAASLGDEPHLSARYCDNHRIWACVYEKFFTRGGGHALLADDECRRLLAQAWYYAGRELIAHDHARPAAFCFRMSVRWNPWRTKYCGCMLRALLGAWRRESRLLGSPSIRARREADTVAAVR